jgi:hypothetical protein
MRGKVLIALCVIIVNFCHAQQQEKKNEILQDSSAKNYPVPPANKSMLFYLQRTHNTNTIVYALNFNSDSTLNESEPVIVYWIRYADGGGTAPLTSIQRSFAYGVSAQMFNKEKKWFAIHLVAYNKADIYLMNSKTDKTYRAFTNINGKLAQLNRIFFKTDGDSFWSPNVVYIELKGKDISTGKSVTERFVPSK